MQFLKMIRFARKPINSLKSCLSDEFSLVVKLTSVLGTYDRSSSTRCFNERMPGMSADIRETTQLTSLTPLKKEGFSKEIDRGSIARFL